MYRSTRFAAYCSLKAEPEKILAPNEIDLQTLKLKFQETIGLYFERVSTSPFCLSSLFLCDIGPYFLLKVIQNRHILNYVKTCHIRFKEDT